MSTAVRRPYREVTSLTVATAFRRSSYEKRYQREPIFLSGGRLLLCETVREALYILVELPHRAAIGNHSMSVRVWHR